MSVSKVHSAQTDIGNRTIIDVEADLARGLYSFSIVGLPDKAVEEAKDRVNSAIKNSDFESPKSKNKKIIISLAPSYIKKEGTSFDLPIAIAYLLATGEIQFDPADKMFLGELSLDGSLRKVKGALPAVLLAKQKGFKEVFIPFDNEDEVSMVEGIDIYSGKNLKEIISNLESKNKIKNVVKKQKIENLPKYEVVFEDIKGHELPKRALTIGASGGHNILFWGPPGSGKTLLAKALISILPQLEEESALEVSSIHSIEGILENGIVLYPPFRSPHHTSSHVAITGGGPKLRAGEITLAHKGVLFLDEFPEFDRRVIESLREPLEEKHIRISRAKGSAIFPADIILIAAMNPCPCGNFGSSKPCVCPPQTLLKYQRKISGPILDRIDIVVCIDEIKTRDLSKKELSQTSKSISEIVSDARNFQKERFKKYSSVYTLNKEIKGKDVEKLCQIKKEALELLHLSGEKLSLSPRSFHRTIRVARTIADLDKKEFIEDKHILEALQFRGKREFI